MPLFASQGNKRGLIYTSMVTTVFRRKKYLIYRLWRGWTLLAVKSNTIALRAHERPLDLIPKKAVSVFVETVVISDWNCCQVPFFNHCVVNSVSDRFLRKLLNRWMPSSRAFNCWVFSVSVISTSLWTLRQTLYTRAQAEVKKEAQNDNFLILVLYVTEQSQILLWNLV